MEFISSRYSGFSYSRRESLEKSKHIMDRFDLDLS
jgi:hypothetical protein